jgi:hypothetical protein
MSKKRKRNRLPSKRKKEKEKGKGKVPVVRSIRREQTTFGSGQGGERASPFIILGSGFLLALFAVFEIRGTPWIIRGSFMKFESSFAGTGVG